MPPIVSRLRQVLPRVIGEVVDAQLTTPKEVAYVMGYRHRSAVTKIKRLVLGMPSADKVEALSVWLSDKYGIHDLARCFSAERYVIVRRPQVEINDRVDDEACRILTLDGCAVRSFASTSIEELRAAERDAMDAIAEQHQLLAEVRAKIERLQERRAA